MVDTHLAMPGDSQFPALAGLDQELASTALPGARPRAPRGVQVGIGLVLAAGLAGGVWLMVGAAGTREPANTDSAGTRDIPALTELAGTKQTTAAGAAEQEVAEPSAKDEPPLGAKEGVEAQNQAASADTAAAAASTQTTTTEASPASSGAKAGTDTEPVAPAAGEENVAAQAAQADEASQPGSAVEIPADATPASLLKEARSVAHDGRMEEARVLFEAVLERAPDEHHAMYYLTRIYLRQGRAADALPMTTRMVEKRARRAPYWLVHAEVLLEVGRRDEAIAAWQKVLEVEPGHPQAQRRLEAVGAAP